MTESIIGLRKDDMQNLLAGLMVFHQGVGMVYLDARRSRQPKRDRELAGIDITNVVVRRKSKRNPRSTPTLRGRSGANNGTQPTDVGELKVPRIRSGHTRRLYSEDFRNAILKELDNGGTPSTVGKKYKLSSAMIYKWRKRTRVKK